MNYHLRTQNRVRWGLLMKEVPSVPKKVGNYHPGYSQYSLQHVFSFSVRSSIQLSEAEYNLPYQSGSTSYYSVCMILVSSNVVNERQNKFYSGLYQHHIRYKRKRRSNEVALKLADIHSVSKFPNTWPPSWRLRSRELVIQSYTRLFFLILQVNRRGRYSLTNRSMYIYVVGQMQSLSLWYQKCEVQYFPSQYKKHQVTEEI